MNHQTAQPITDKDLLEVHSIFYSIQGEGPFSGRPAVFIRLAGCNLQCPQCDTAYTSGARFLSALQIVRKVQRFTPKGLVVITGGEPFRQAIGPLVERLYRLNYKVQIETNGTLVQDIVWAHAYIVCSPKTPFLNDKMIPYIKAFKYVVTAGLLDPLDGLPRQCMGIPDLARSPARPPSKSKVPVYLSPLDSKNPVENTANLQAAIVTCLKHNYHLCIQIHKVVGLD